MHKNIVRRRGNNDAENREIRGWDYDYLLRKKTCDRIAAISGGHAVQR
jgi:hypothetical protein